MRSFGILLIWAAVAVPLFWSIPLASQFGISGIASQYFGTVSLILMGITQLIATRIRGIETIFGSLDRVYVLHKWLAVGALVTAFLHGQIDADAGKIAIGGITDLAEEIGELSFNGLVVLIGASLMTIIPYKYWKWSHRLIGIFFALAAFHFVFIMKPYSTFDIPGLYTTFFCAMGVLSYLYLLVPRAFGHNTTRYTVSNIAQHNGVTEVNLTPNRRAVKHKVGQFSFVSFDQDGLEETHPFTISSMPQSDDSLRFMIKGLGGYTKQLGTSLKRGTTARVSKAYGHFLLKPTKGAQVWIGAGVGITPFMAWTQALPSDWSTPVHLYYCVKTADDALYLNEFEAAVQRNPHFTFTLVTSDTGKRLSAKQIATALQDDVRHAHVYFCGPAQMRQSLKNGLVERGLRPSNFHNEEFEMRTSIGILDRFQKRILKRVTRLVS